MWGCGTEGHCLVMGLSRSGWWLDLVILRVFSKLDDSVILWKLYVFATSEREQHATMLERDRFIYLLFHLAPTIDFSCIYSFQPSGEGADLELSMFLPIPSYLLDWQEIFSPFFCFCTHKTELRMMLISFAHFPKSASELGWLLCFNHAHYVDNFVLIILTLLIEIELFHNYS